MNDWPLSYKFKRWERDLILSFVTNMCVRSCVRVCVCVSFIECFMSFVLIWIILPYLIVWNNATHLEGEKNHQLDMAQNHWNPQAIKSTSKYDKNETCVTWHRCYMHANKYSTWSTWPPSTWQSNSRNLTVRNIFASARVLPAKIIMEFITFYMLAYCVHIWFHFKLMTKNNKIKTENWMWIISGYHITVKLSISLYTLYACL